MRTKWMTLDVRAADWRRTVGVRVNHGRRDPNWHGCLARTGSLSGPHAALLVTMCRWTLVRWLALLLVVAACSPSGPSSSSSDDDGDASGGGSALRWTALATTDRVADASWSPDDRHIAVAFPDNIFAVIDASGPEVVAESDGVNFPASIAWDSTGERLIGAAIGVRLYQMPNLAYTATLVETPTSSDAVAWSDGSDRVAIAVRSSGSGTAGSAVRVLQPGPGSDWSEVARIDTAASIVGLEWSPDGEAFVATGRGTRPGFVYDAAVAGRRFDILAAELARWSPDGSRLAVLAEDELRIVDGTSGSTVDSVAHPDATALAWSRDATALYVGDRDGTVERRPSHALAIRDRLTTLPSAVTSLAMAHTRDELAIGTSLHGLTLLDPAEGKQSRLAPYGSRLQVARFDPTGRFLATSALRDARVRIWDTETGLLLHEIPAPDENVGTHDVAWRPDGARLAVAGSTREERPPSLRIFESETWTLTDELANPADGAFAGFHAIDWLAMDTIAAYLPGFPAAYRLFDLNAGTYQDLPVSVGNIRGPTVLAASEDRSTLVSVTSTGLARYDVASGTTRGIDSDHSLDIVAVDSYGEHAVTGHKTLDDTPVVVWDLDTGRALIELTDVQDRLFWLQALGFSPEGRYVWAAGQRTGDSFPKVLLYDVETGALVSEAVTADVYSADVSSDGTMLAVGSWTGRLEVYDLSWLLEEWRTSVEP